MNVEWFEASVSEMIKNQHSTQHIVGAQRKIVAAHP